jgi:hypothetical protein
MDRAPAPAPRLSIGLISRLQVILAARDSARSSPFAAFSVHAEKETNPQAPRGALFWHPENSTQT